MAVKRWNGTSWDTYSANPNLNNTLSQWKKTAAGGETTLSGNDDSSINLVYTVGQESVYINGVLQVRGSDYTATNGSSIVLVNQLVAGNIVQVISPLLLPMSSVIPLSTIAAKGDLMIGTASSVPARLPIGANDQVLVADSTNSNGMAWKSYGSQYEAGKNYLINGNFDFFQRTSFASQTSSAYTFDRWYGGVGGTVTLTQQTTGVPLGSQYCGRIAYNAASSFCNLYQALESALVTTLIGRTITVSVKVRRNASFAANLTLGLDWGNTANTLAGGSWTEFATSTLTNAAMPTGTTSSDWATISVTTTVPTNALGLRVHIYENVVGPSGAYWEVAQAQLELGSVATPFSRAGGSIGGELALCQRYYWRADGGWGANAPFGQGIAGNTTSVGCMIRYPVPMRINPTVIEFSNLALNDYNTNTAVTSITAGNANNLAAYHNVYVASGLTQYRLYTLLTNNNSNGYFAISAEL